MFKENKFVRFCIKLFKRNQNFAMYIAIGVLGVAVDFIFFYLFYIILQVDPIISNIFSNLIAICHNYTLNYFLNFKKKDKFFKSFVYFLFIGIIGISLSSILLYILGVILGLNIYISKALVMFIVVIIQYNLNKAFTFKK